MNPVSEAVRRRRIVQMRFGAVGAGIVFVAAVAWETYRQSMPTTPPVTLHPFGTSPDQPARAPAPAFAASAPPEPAASAPSTLGTAPARNPGGTLISEGKDTRSDGPAPPYSASEGLKYEASTLLMSLGSSQLAGQRAQQSLQMLLDLAPSLARMPRRLRVDLDLLEQAAARPGRMARMSELLHENMGVEKIERSRKFFARDDAVQQFVARLDTAVMLKPQQVRQLADGVRQMSDWRQRAVMELASLTHVWGVESHLARVVLPALIAVVGVDQVEQPQAQALARDIALARVAHATAPLDDPRLWDLIQRISRPEIESTFDWGSQAYMGEMGQIVQLFGSRLRRPPG